MEADHYFDLSIAISPDKWEAYYAKAYNYIDWSGDLKRARTVLENMPGKDRNLQRRMLRLRYLERDYEGILDFVSLASEPWAWLFWWAGDVYSSMGEPELAQAYYDSARSILEKDIVENPDNAFTHRALGIAYAGLGRKDEAILKGKRALELLPVSTDAYHGTDLVKSLAVIYAMVGEYDAALDEIEYLLSIPSGVSVQTLRIDPDFDPLRDHPRFHELLEEYAID